MFRTAKRKLYRQSTIFCRARLDWCIKIITSLYRRVCSGAIGSPWAHRHVGTSWPFITSIIIWRMISETETKQFNFQLHSPFSFLWTSLPFTTIRTFESLLIYLVCIINCVSKLHVSSVSFPPIEGYKRNITVTAVARSESQPFSRFSK